jgi:hypothetical protein
LSSLSLVANSIDLFIPITSKWFDTANTVNETLNRFQVLFDSFIMQLRLKMGAKKEEENEDKPKAKEGKSKKNKFRFKQKHIDEHNNNQ